MTRKLTTIGSPLPLTLCALTLCALAGCSDGANPTASKDRTVDGSATIALPPAAEQPSAARRVVSKDGSATATLPPGWWVGPHFLDTTPFSFSNYRRDGEPEYPGFCSGGEAIPRGGVFIRLWEFTTAFVKSHTMSPRVIDLGVRQLSRFRTPRWIYIWGRKKPTRWNCGSARTPFYVSGRRALDIQIWANPRPSAEGTAHRQPLDPRSRAEIDSLIHSLYLKPTRTVPFLAPNVSATCRGKRRGRHCRRLRVVIQTRAALSEVSIDAGGRAGALNPMWGVDPLPASSPPAFPSGTVWSGVVRAPADPGSRPLRLAAVGILRDGVSVRQPFPPIDPPWATPGRW